MLNSLGIRDFSLFFMISGTEICQNNEPGLTSLVNFLLIQM